MKTRIWLITLLLAASAVAGAAEWQLVLLKPPACAGCFYVEEVLRRSGQIRQVTLQDAAGGTVTADIVRRNASDLSAQEWSELKALPYIREAQWRQQAAELTAQILLKRDGVVVSAGTIADSADLRSVRYPENLNSADIGGDLLAARNARGSFIGELSLRSWNFNWFYRLALDPRLPASRQGLQWTTPDDAVLPRALGPTNVMLMATASGAIDNEIFNALRIEEIRDVLAQSLAFDPARIQVFYGGSNPQGANALEMRGGRIGLVRRDVAEATPFTPEAVQRIFRSIRARPGSRNLLVLIGHGNADGAGMWGSVAPLSPGALRALHEHGAGDDVLVSGNCYGGVMARATSCGFFGARPDIVATGCQADAAEVAQSRDYLHTFFSALTPGARRLVDADGDGAVSFVEAHWYASTEGDVRNISYTSIDALADAWYESRAGDAPRALPVADILALAADAPAAEARALRGLLTGYQSDLMVSLQDLAGQASRWRPGAGPRPLVAQMARRMLFRKAGEQRAELSALQACESRAVEAFLKP
jgi:hypothetical protein